MCKLGTWGSVGTVVVSGDVYVLFRCSNCADYAADIVSMEDVTMIDTDSTGSPEMTDTAEDESDGSRRDGHREDGWLFE